MPLLLDNAPATRQLASSALSLTYSFNYGGGAGAIYVAVVCTANMDISGVTWNGQALTRMVNTTSPSNNDCEIWRLLNPAGTGAANVVISATGSPGLILSTALSILGSISSGGATSVSASATNTISVGNGSWVVIAGMADTVNVSASTNVTATPTENPVIGYFGPKTGGAGNVSLTYAGSGALSVAVEVIESAGGPASAITLSGPSSGPSGVASSPFTVGVTPSGGSITGTVVVTPSAGGGGGMFTPSAVSLSNASPTGTFTYTPSSAGAKTISVTNNGGLGNPSSLTYTVGATGTVPVGDTNWRWSPYNWATVGSQRVAVNGGAYFKLGFTGTSCSIALDVSSMVAGSVPSGWYPTLRYSVDNGPLTDVQLTPTTTALAVSGLASGSHTIEVWYLRGWWENIGGTAPDRWSTPVYCIKVGAATLDAGASSVAPVWLPASLAWFGDSISEGIRAENSTTQPGCQNAYESVPAYVAQALGCELGNVSFGGLAWSSGFNSIPGFSTSYASVFSGASRLVGGLLSPAPAYVCLWLGANGGATSGEVQTAITNMRAIAPTARVCVIVPVGGFGRSGIAAGVAAYLSSNPAERRVHLIDLGSSWEVGLNGFGSASKQAIDNLHPRATWNARIAAAIAQRISALASLPGATRSVTVTLYEEDGTTPAANKTGLNVSFWARATLDAIDTPPDAVLPNRSTNSLGVLTFSVNTSLASGGVGLLAVSTSNGSPSQASFVGTLVPVTVS